MNKADGVRALIDGQPLSHLQWRVFAVCLFMNALDGMDVLVISYAAPMLASEWSIEPGALGVVFSAGLLGMTLGAMLIAPMADRLGRRVMILMSLMLSGAGVLATAWADNVNTLMALRFVSGLGIGAMLASVATMAAEYAPDRMRNLVVASVMAGYPIGATLFGLGAAEIIPAYGWQTLFTVAGCTTLLTLPLVWFALPESLNFLLRVRPDGAMVAANRILGAMGHQLLTALPQADSKAPTSGVRHLFTPDFSRSTVLLWCAFFMSFAALYFLTSWIPKLASSAGLSLELSIYAGAVFNFGAVFGIALCGWLSQKLGLRHAIAGFLLATALTMMVFGLASGSWLVLLLFGLIGFFLQGGFVGLYAVAARLYPTENRTTGVGWAIGAGRTGAIAGPVIGGQLVAAGLSISANFRWFSIATIAAAILVLMIRSSRVR